MLIRAGDKVKKGHNLLKLGNTQFSSSFDESEVKEAQLMARAQRLTAEAFSKPFKAVKASTDPRIQILYDREYRLYEGRYRQHQTNDDILAQQIEQKKLELEEARSQNTPRARSR